eukprot:TRINITY_DN5612_c0_g4_i2.p2 TRINITY_DN5612_c0_g4~~TRINITY_DN5612_c0_g4_i2.p2  ORF type:complete len:167 (+),score=33.81 TRINITY_DN5612_c0_g4_i2:341-841(+)
MKVLSTLLLVLLVVVAYGATDCSKNPADTSSNDGTSECSKAIEVSLEAYGKDTTKYTNDKTCGTLSGEAMMAPNKTSCPSGDELVDLKACNEKFLRDARDNECKSEVKEYAAYVKDCKDGNTSALFGAEFICESSLYDFLVNDAMTSAIAPLLMALFAGIALYTML